MTTAKKIRAELEEAFSGGEKDGVAAKPGRHALGTWQETALKMEGASAEEVLSAAGKLLLIIWGKKDSERTIRQLPRLIDAVLE